MPVSECPVTLDGIRQKDAPPDRTVRVRRVEAAVRPDRGVGTGAQIGGVDSVGQVGIEDQLAGVTRSNQDGEEPRAPRHLGGGDPALLGGLQLGQIDGLFVNGWDPDDVARLAELLARFNVSIEGLEGRRWPRP